MLLRLQQVADSTLLVGAENEKHNAKLDMLDDLIEDLTDSEQKVIVFSKFRTMVELLLERYSKYNPAVIHGDVDAHGYSETHARRLVKKKHPDFDSKTEEEQKLLIEEAMESERQHAIQKFQTDDSCKLFIGCSPACREGITLTAATHVVFLDLEWNWACFEQAFSRAHRIGQKNAVTVHLPQCRGTIDEYIWKVINKKNAMAEALMADGSDSMPLDEVKQFVADVLGVELN